MLFAKLSEKNINFLTCDVYSMIAQALSDVGLTSSESKIYLSLVNLGPSPATDISKNTGIHRANVYSTLHRLSKIGLVTTSKLDKHVLFSANSPDVLLSLLKEKEESLKSIIPQLILKSNLNESLDIEVITGLSGTISILFSLQKLNGPFFFVGSENNLPIGLSAKLSLLFSQNDVISKRVSSDILIFFRENVVLFIFVTEMKTLKIKSFELVELLKDLMI
ncbi:hypothetical protein JXA48_00910 [Candidatus Woesearchaeota archaeon]|nr:hypothetical protein [Candidatus Woesearchaeota archaeon]